MSEVQVLSVRYDVALQSARHEVLKMSEDGMSKNEACRTELYCKCTGAAYDSISEQFWLGTLKLIQPPGLCERSITSGMIQLGGRSVACNQRATCHDGAVCHTCHTIYGKRKAPRRNVDARRQHTTKHLLVSCPSFVGEEGGTSDVRDRQGTSKLHGPHNLSDGCSSLSFWLIHDFFCELMQWTNALKLQLPRWTR